MLSTSELARYRRQMVLPEVGSAGQDRLRASRVLVVGAGGLGSPVSLYLAAAGVGTIGIIDHDSVEVSNLHRQVVHGTADIGVAKVQSAQASITRLNPDVRVVALEERLTAPLARELFDDFDLIVDGSDNFATRYVVNDAAATLRKTWVYGSVERFTGQVSVFAPDGPCYRCVFPEPPSPGTAPSCDDIGVLGSVPGVIGCLQATEVLKLILGLGQPLIGKLFQLDLSRSEATTILLDKNPDCPACGVAAEPHDDGDAVDIEPRELERRFGDGTLSLLDIREPWEWSIGHIAGARLLNMRDLPEHVEALANEGEVILYCHHGTRSGAATDWLRAQGVRARNLVGGIDRWSREIDPSIPRY